MRRLASATVLPAAITSSASLSLLVISSGVFPLRHFFPLLSSGNLTSILDQLSGGRSLVGYKRWARGTRMRENHTPLRSSSSQDASEL